MMDTNQKNQSELENSDKKSLPKTNEDFNKKQPLPGEPDLTKHTPKKDVPKIGDDDNTPQEDDTTDESKEDETEDTTEDETDKPNDILDSGIPSVK